MRLAVLADIHGNADALRAVMADLADASPDLTVNLGDCFSGPLAARETGEILRAAGWPTVRGNHDRYLTDFAPGAMQRSDRQALAELRKEDIAWLGTLPVSLVVEEFLLVHATPTDDNLYLTETVHPDGNVTLRDADAIRADLNGVSEKTVLCGHTHIPRLIALPGGPTIFNPGSIGAPAYHDTLPYPHLIEAGSPHAVYGLITRQNGRLRFEHRFVPYDTAGMAALATRRQRLDWAHALATGFALRT